MASRRVCRRWRPSLDSVSLRDRSCQVIKQLVLFYGLFSLSLSRRSAYAPLAHASRLCLSVSISLSLRLCLLDVCVCLLLSCFCARSAVYVRRSIAADGGCLVEKVVSFFYFSTSVSFAPDPVLCPCNVRKRHALYTSRKSLSTDACARPQMRPFRFLHAHQTSKA